MALFKFIETFFFISLAITFLLVLLLVYHFKQRLGLIEQKTDNMFEIVNNIVKELNIIRNAQINSNKFSGFPQVPHLSNMSPPFFIPQIPQDINNIYVSVTENKENEINGLEDSHDEDDEDSDDEDSDDEDDEDSDDEDDDDSDDEDIDSDKEVVIDNLDDITIETTGDNIKVVHMEELSNIDFEVVSENIQNTIEPIQIEKINQPIIETEPISISEPFVVGEYSKDVVRKMSVQELKTLVITKGLCSDPSKMKKIELIKMLENNQE